ncbi:hypothetical protein F4778DRAFT_111576 [Xylariomycetidae sp. FL2044]|nr:hypothetical protein F4778DRAFT_111576 [Xylariomycetidae sp. FL2044]
MLSYIPLATNLFLAIVQADTFGIYSDSGCVGDPISTWTPWTDTTCRLISFPENTYIMLLLQDYNWGTNPQYWHEFKYPGQYPPCDGRNQQWLVKDTGECHSTQNFHANLIYNFEYDDYQKSINTAVSQEPTETFTILAGVAGAAAPTTTTTMMATEAGGATTPTLPAQTTTIPAPTPTDSGTDPGGQEGPTSTSTDDASGAESPTTTSDGDGVAIDAGTGLSEDGRIGIGIGVPSVFFAAAAVVVALRRRG